uniref:HAUS augmin like complex subunit 2 n=1 Tax=Colobus angolensis palliatus TaxID=336983 RepID=A0A2K5HVD4_COLAP
MAAANPWDPASAPNGAGLVLGHLIASGMVNQEMLNMSKKTASCFVNFTRLQQITDIEAEIYQKNLEIELLKLEKDTADVVHPFFLEMRFYYVAQAGLKPVASVLPVQSPKTLRLQLRSVILCKA